MLGGMDLYEDLRTRTAPFPNPGNPAAVKTDKEEECRKQLEEAINLHQQAVLGDKEALKAAEGSLKKLYALCPQNRRVQAYLGSISALKGRDILDPIERFKCANRGLKALDQAVSGDKENVEIRMLRANVCLRLPEMYFHRSKTAVEDFTHILGKYEKDAGVLTAEQYRKCLFDLGCAYKNMDLMKQANTVWDRLLAAEDGCEYKGQVEAERSNLPEKSQDTGNVPSPGPDSTPKKKVWRTL